MKRIANVVLKTMGVVFIVFCIYLVSLFFHSQQLPDWLVGEVCDRMSSGDLVVSADGAHFGFCSGVRIDGLRVYNRASFRALEPLVSADEITIGFLPKRIRAVSLKVPRLHDAYYEPGAVTEPMGENDGRFSFPDLGRFELELDRPDVLGVAPLRVRSTLDISTDRIDFSGIRLVWPDADAQLGLDGFCTIDVGRMRVTGKVDGTARQPHIRPMLGDYERPVTLDVPVALPYFDAFTEVTKPVPARCSWDVNLVNNDFEIVIGLEPELGRYNDVPLKEAEGQIRIRVWWVGGKMEFETSVDVRRAVDRQGREFGGRVSVIETNGVRSVRLATKSDLKKEDALNVMGYLNDGILDCFECATPPHVEAEGVLAPNLIDRYLNDIRGSIACESARFFGIAVSNVITRFAYVNEKMRFDNVRAKGRTGGDIGGSAEIHIQDFGDGKRDPTATYSVDIDYRNGSVEELSDVFKFDLGKRHGKVELDMHLFGQLYTNEFERLCGHGKVKVKSGHLAQMRLFSGLTELLAEKVPGVGTVVNLSDASGSFAITNGVLSSHDVRIEGALFSISGAGSYDIVRDDLDFTVRVRLMKDDSTPVLKELVRLVSWPFSKLTLEFSVRGPLDNPKWAYISLVDRML